MGAPSYLPKYLRERLEDWCDDDYTGDENGYIIVTTSCGWAYEPHELEEAARHVFSGTTIKECIEKLKYCGECHCARCKRKEG
jgi:hypothetical protein